MIQLPLKVPTWSTTALRTACSPWAFEGYIYTNHNNNICIQTKREREIATLQQTSSGSSVFEWKVAEKKKWIVTLSLCHSTNYIKAYSVETSGNTTLTK
jgi:hypothetical protein